MSMEVSKWLVSWFITYLWDLQPTYIGVITQLLSTMDIPVGSKIETMETPQNLSFQSSQSQSNGGNIAPGSAIFREERPCPRRLS